jgi:hypothetical protein
MYSVNKIIVNIADEIVRPSDKDSKCHESNRLNDTSYIRVLSGHISDLYRLQSHLCRPVCSLTVPNAISLITF